MYRKKKKILASIIFALLFITHSHIRYVEQKQFVLQADAHSFVKRAGM